MKPVLILGAGINGAAVARELALNGISVCLVDHSDIASGATSRSSRLIHGGLRYLEYRDIALVKESLLEREELLRTAPQFVTPLTLSIPVSDLGGGLWQAFQRFSGLSRSMVARLLKRSAHPKRRGLAAVRIGLTLYDWLARKSFGSPGIGLRRHCVEKFDHRDALPEFNRREVRWVCCYSDAQILWPERFVIALLRDGQSAAQKSGTRFDVLPYCSAEFRGGVVELRSIDSGVVHEIEPSLVINATGASGDRTLLAAGAVESQLFAGTKGSHLFSTYLPLKNALHGQGVYAEAEDGRLVFILPCGVGVLIGTTDEPFDDAPESAVATDHEIGYLLDLVNSILPKVELRREHIVMHHAGVRPLPRTHDSNTSAIPRGHSIQETEIGGLRLMTLVGGKLTTCRALSEEVTDRVLEVLNRERTTSTKGRPLVPCDFESAIGKDVSMELARWSLRNEWVTRLSDLVERRLLLVFHPVIRLSTLNELADEMVQVGLLDPAARTKEIEACTQRLRDFYGRVVLSIENSCTTVG